MILEYSFKNIFNTLLEEVEDKEGVNNSSQKKIKPWTYTVFRKKKIHFST